MSPPHRPTLRSLAAQAGVTPMTVSLALRNSREISSATRKRIQRLARAAGYRPDPTIVRLMHHLRTRAPSRFKTTLCGIGERFPADQFARGNYGDRLHDGLRRRAESLGFAYERLYFDDYPSGAKLQRVLLSRGVEGLIIMPLRRSADLSDRLDWGQFATVSATPAVLAPRFHGVMPNHFDNMLVLCRALQQAGCRRIGLAIPEEWNRRVKYRWAGGIAWQNFFGGTLPVQPLFTTASSNLLDPAQFADWLLRERPDAVITDSTHHSALEPGLRQLRPKQRPKMVTMNWPDPAADAGIDQCGEYIGAIAVEVLAGMLARGERGVPAVAGTTMVDGVWMEGKLHRANPSPARPG